MFVSSSFQPKKTATWSSPKKIQKFGTALQTIPKMQKNFSPASSTM
jgi:hypothetical protein